MRGSRSSSPACGVRRATRAACSSVGRPAGSATTRWRRSCSKSSTRATSRSRSPQQQQRRTAALFDCTYRILDCTARPRLAPPRRRLFLLPAPARPPSPSPLLLRLHDPPQARPRPPRTSRPPRRRRPARAAERSVRAFVGAFPLSLSQFVAFSSPSVHSSLLFCNSSFSLSSTLYCCSSRVSSSSG